METRQVNTYSDAITAALEWLKDRGIKDLDEAYESRRGGFGMRTLDGSSGYRLEFDSTMGAHINVWHHKTKGPPFFSKATNKMSGQNGGSFLVGSQAQVA